MGYFAYVAHLLSQFGANDAMSLRSTDPFHFSSLAGIPNLDCVGCHSRGKVSSQIYLDFDLDNVQDDEVRSALQGTVQRCQDAGDPGCQQRTSRRSSWDPLALAEFKLEKQRAARRSYGLPPKTSKLKRAATDQSGEVSSLSCLC